MKANGSHTQRAWPPTFFKPIHPGEGGWASVCLACAKFLIVLRIRSALLTLAHGVWSCPHLTSPPSPYLLHSSTQGLPDAPQTSWCYLKALARAIPPDQNSLPTDAPTVAHPPGLGSKVVFSERLSLTPSCCSLSSSCLIFFYQRLYWDVSPHWFCICLSLDLEL